MRNSKVSVSNAESVLTAYSFLRIHSASSKQLQNKTCGCFQRFFSLLSQVVLIVQGKILKMT